MHKLVFTALANANELSYQHRVLSVKIHDNNFAGLPRPELDAAWHDLFESEKHLVWHQRAP